MCVFYAEEFQRKSIVIKKWLTYQYKSKFSLSYGCHFPRDTCVKITHLGSRCEQFGFSIHTAIFRGCKTPTWHFIYWPQKHFSFFALAKCGSYMEALSQGGKGVLRTLLLPVYGPQFQSTTSVHKLLSTNCFLTNEWAKNENLTVWAQSFSYSDRRNVY